MKKYICLILSVLLLCFGLTACLGDKEEAPSTDATQGAPPSAPSEPDGAEDAASDQTPEKETPSAEPETPYDGKPIDLPIIPFL